MIRRLTITVGTVTLLLPAVQPLQGQTGARATQIVTFSVLPPQRMDLAGKLLLRNSSQLTQDASSKITVAVLPADTLQAVVPHHTIQQAGTTTSLPPEAPHSVQPSRKSTVYTITE